MRPSVTKKEKFSNANATVGSRYLSLLKQALTDYHRITENDVSWEQSVSILQRKALRKEGRDWPLHADTLVGLVRLDQFQLAIETVVHDNIPGDIVETGVWRGGACILGRAVLEVLGVKDRAIWLADSFCGLPRPKSDRYPADFESRLYLEDYLRVDRSTVEANFAKYGLLDKQVCFLPGWFSDTLPSAPIQRISVLRLDGDMYESTWIALESLYDRVSEGGFVIVDDYGAIAACREATDLFRAQRGICAKLEVIDWTGVFWRVGAAGSEE